MPGKVNPVLAEMLYMVCFHALGNDTAILHAAQAGQLELNVMMPIIGYNLLQEIEILTGGIGSGKSVVAEMFRELGITIIDADQIAHDLVKPGSPVLAAVIGQFGKTYLNADGGLDRQKLAHYSDRSYPHLRQGHYPSKSE